MHIDPANATIAIFLLGIAWKLGRIERSIEDLKSIPAQLEDTRTTVAADSARIDGITDRLKTLEAIPSRR